MSLFKKADRRKKKLRLALDGPAKSGKTLTALRFAMELGRHEAAKQGRPGQPRVAVIDTENASAAGYQGDVYDGHPIEFDVIELADFSPTRYSELTREAGRLGYDVLVIDSLSHAWSGKGGALELVDKKTEQNRGNSFSGWKDITPLQNEMIETIIRSSCHVIVTMRTKTEWVMETNERGKTVPRKIGLAPVQRQGVEYEFDIFIDVDSDHIAHVSGSRCGAIDGKCSTQPGAEFFRPVLHWLEQGSNIPQEILDQARLTDDAKSTSATPASQSASAAISEADLEARMAAKRAASNGTSGASNAAANSAVQPAASPTTPVAAAGDPQAAVTTSASPQAAGASVQAAASPIVNAPATVATEASPTQFSIMAQIEIESLFKQLGAPPEAIQAACQKRGAATIGELADDAMRNLLEPLRAMAEGKAPSVSPAAVAAAATIATPVATANSPALITASQKDRIRELFIKLQVPDEARAKAYEKRGVVSIDQLTEANAADLIRNLESKLPAPKPEKPAKAEKVPATTAP